MIQDHINAIRDILLRVEGNRKKRLAFYTCFLGSDSNWANVIPPVPSHTEDCYYFTNNPGTYEQLASTGWIRMWLDIPIENDNVRDSMNYKYLRCCPTKFDILCNYEYLCWMDSKLVVTDVERVYTMMNSLVGTKCIALTRHPIPHVDVWGEYTLALQYPKYALQKDQYAAYITKRLQEGFDEKKPLRQCVGFSVRKQCPMSETIGKTWYSHIQECGIECQISWQFVAQQFESSIEEFEYQYCWTYL
jgi:hypothetical protein